MASLEAATSLDEKARRVRSLLSSYYGAEESEEGAGGSGSVVVDTTSLDKATFDADRCAASAPLAPSSAPADALTRRPLVLVAVGCAALADT